MSMPVLENTQAGKEGKTGLILRQGNGSGMGGLVQPEQTQQVPADAPSLK